MPNYNNGKIYKIYNTITDDIYIGATTKSLCARLGEHKRTGRSININTNKIYKCFKEYDADNFFIELLEIYNCNSKAELYTKEGDYIRALKPTLNMYISGRTVKQYLEDNKEAISAQKRIHYEHNKDCNKERKREYNKKYKERKKQENTNTV